MTEDKKHGLEHRPSLGLKEFIAPRAQDEGVPSGDSEGANEEVFVR